MKILPDTSRMIQILITSNRLIIWLLILKMSHLVLYIFHILLMILQQTRATGFLIRLGFVHGNMILIAFVIAYFISNFVTKSLDSIGETIKKQIFKIKMLKSI